MIKFRKLIEPINNIELIARRFSIDELNLLRQKYGGRNWRKLKGQAYVELLTGEIRLAELHWYECHGIGKRKMKIKLLLD
ncbi:MAG TPA: hypothetical protein VK892_16600 [Pyrinomonadaceae bacterium]|nr:hypothetical protein [Pyrinomonadaceae bacterium]